VRVHLVDATYELFRAYHAPRPAVRGRDGMPLTAVAGLVGTLLALLRDEGATHVACAHDRVIRSFRNDLWPGYKTEAGVPPDLLAQFPVAEEAILALGLPLWAMVELEADDALATAAARFADDPAVSQVLVCTPDKDLAQCVRDGRVVLRDRRRDLVYDDAGVRAKWGVPPAAIPDWLALVGDAADGFPGIKGFGAVSASSLLAAFGTLERIREAPVTSWPGSVRGASRLAGTLRGSWSDALLFRQLATLRLDAPIRERAAAELLWPGTDDGALAAFCDRWQLPGLRRRPHRWRDT
jgi:5'-3' exonuclease